MSSVSVRPRPRLLPPRRAERTSPDLPGLAAYTSPAMQITDDARPQVHHRARDRAARRAPRPRRSSDAVRHLSRRTRVPGFRPGKAPRPVLERALGPGAVLDDAVDHLVQDAYREALVEQEILPLTNADVEVVQAEEGKPLVFKATVQVRPEVKLGDYKGFNFGPEIETIDDAQVDQVIEELRDQNATLTAVEDRGAKDGDYAVIAFVGTRDGDAVRGRHLGADAADHRPGAADPGLRDQPRRPRVRAARPSSTSRSPTTTARPSWPGDRPLRGRAQGAPREGAAGPRRRLRRPMGEFADLDALRADIKTRLEGNALDQARHEFADRIIEYAVANATLDLPDVLVDQEVEVMHDEFRASLARQGITEEAYLKVTDKTDADLHAEFRPGAEKRVKMLLVLSQGRRSRRRRGARRGRRGRGRARPASATRATRSSSPTSTRSAAASYIRSTIRRSRVVERLIDGWLAAHPEHPRCRTSRTRRRRSIDERSGGGQRRDRRDRSRLHPRPTSRRPPADHRTIRPSSPDIHRQRRGPRCSSRWSSSPPAEASAPTTSTRASCGSGSSSSATRSRTTWPTS